METAFRSSLKMIVVLVFYFNVIRDASSVIVDASGDGVSAATPVPKCTSLPVTNHRTCCNYNSNMSCCRDWTAWHTKMTHCNANNLAPYNLTVEQISHELRFLWTAPLNDSDVFGYRLSLSCQWENRESKSLPTALISSTECFELNSKEMTMVQVTPYACKDRYSWLPNNCLHSSIYAEFYRSAKQDATARCQLHVSSLPAVSHKLATITKTFELTSCRDRGCPLHRFAFRHGCNEFYNIEQLSQFKSDNYTDVRLCECDIRKPSWLDYDSGMLKWSPPNDTVFASHKYNIRFYSRNSGRHAGNRMMVSCKDKKICQANMSALPATGGDMFGIQAISSTPVITYSGYAWVAVSNPVVTTPSVASTISVSRRIGNTQDAQTASDMVTSNSVSDGVLSSQGKTLLPAITDDGQAEAENKQGSDYLLVVILVVVIFVLICIAAPIVIKRTCQRSIISENGSARKSYDHSHEKKSHAVDDDTTVTSIGSQEYLETSVQIDERFRLATKPPAPAPALSLPEHSVYISFARYPDSNLERAERLARQLQERGLNVNIASFEFNQHDETYCQNVTGWIEGQMELSRHILVVISSYYPHCCSDRPKLAHLHNKQQQQQQCRQEQLQQQQINEQQYQGECQLQLYQQQQHLKQHQQQKSSVGVPFSAPHQINDTLHQQQQIIDQVDYFSTANVPVTCNGQDLAHVERSNKERMQKLLLLQRYKEERQLSPYACQTESTVRVCNDDAHPTPVQTHGYSASDLDDLDPLAAHECRIIDGLKTDKHRVKNIIPVYLDTSMLPVAVPPYLRAACRYFVNQAGGPASIPSAYRDLTLSFEALVMRLTS
ncbi:uncharacterized protein LOC135809033 isoform X2 [Sycon ciliatum]|uniref:uncharacterized protein LOC135809033 isoform X2 n=1 Tax=Sycon ciliatum TaxID=27933 RepID=UPI0031F6DF04